MKEKLGAGAYAESLGNCCAEASDHVEMPVSTTSAATHARATRRFNPGSGVQLIGIIHLHAASRSERQPFQRRHNHRYLSVLRMHAFDGSEQPERAALAAAS